MDFSLSDDRKMLADTLERFLRANYPIDKRHQFVAGDEGFSREIWAQFAQLGVIGALFGEKDGGFGGEAADIAVVFEALGRMLVVEPFLPTLLAGSMIAELGGEATKPLLESAIAGETLIALAHSEPTSRYELPRVTSTAEKSGDKWLLSGAKAVVLGGGSADMLVVTARTSGDISQEDGISAFLVSASSAGITRRAYGTIDGYGAAEISFDKVEGELLGEAGKAFAALETAWARGIIAVSAESLGAQEVAKDMTVEYMHTRKQFGVIIGKFQALQHRMADVLIEIEQMRSALLNAVGHFNDHRRRREWYVSALKHMAGRIGRQVAEEAIQIHGGIGMTWEYAVGHFAKRIIMIDHLFGDTDHHLQRYIELGEV